MNKLYFVEASHGHFGNAFGELDRDRNSRQQVIDDIRDGQLENVIKVLEVCEDEGTCRDVTEEILEAAGRLHEEEPVLTAVDLRAMQFDHNHDHRKNWEPV